MKTHTPTPWTVLDDFNGKPRILSKTKCGNLYVAQCNVFADAAYIVECVNSHGDLVAELEQFCCIDDAAHIIRCVNSHDHLVAALEKFCRIDTMVAQLGYIGRAALKQAKARP